MLLHAQYDAFLSYKAEDANVVRTVAEQSMACGLRVWFAEYAIPSADFDDDAKLRDAIRAGVSRARCHVVFTNARWARSAWCRVEMESISRLPQARILQVYLSEEDEPAATWPILRDVPSIRFDGDASAVLDRLSALGWIDPGVTPPPGPAVPAAASGRRSMGYGITFDPGPLRDSPALPWFVQRALRRSGEHVYLRGEIAGLHVDALLDVDPHRTVLGEQVVREEGEADDRAIYRSYLGIARDWLGGLRRAEIGFHLVFVGGRSHFAMTSIASGEEDGAVTWERRYALLLTGPNQRSAGELDVTFAVALGATDTKAALAAFQTLTPTFDRIIGSVHTELNFRAFTAQWWSALATRVAILVVAATVADLMSTQVESWLWRGLGWLYVGTAAASTLLMLVDTHGRLQASRLGLLYGPRTRLFPTFGAWLDRAWNHAVGAVLQDVLRLALALRTLPAWLLVAGLALCGDDAIYWVATGAAGSVLGRRAGRFGGGASRPPAVTDAARS